MHIPYVFDCRICQSIDMTWSSAVLAIPFLLGNDINKIIGLEPVSYLYV